MRPIVVMTLACALAACASHPAIRDEPATNARGQVGIEDLSATVASTARLELAEDEHFLGALPEAGNAPPAYPADLLSRRLPPQSVCLRVSVDENGAVPASISIQLPPDCVTSDGVDARFLDAARSAVAAWQFDPAMRCIFDHGRKPDTVTCDGARQVTQAVSLTYRFVFEQRDGRGTVKVAQ
ncbi:energy transducer TonB [Lysobacter fragariae]